MNKNIIFVIIGLIILYVLANIFFPVLSIYLFYPISMFVTFFHEMGHGLFSILSFGSFHNIELNLVAQNGALGTAYTSGGIRILTALGGYIGSTILGLFFISLGSFFDKKYMKIINYIVMGIILLSVIFLGKGIQTYIFGTIMLSFLFIANRLKIENFLYVFIGVFSILHIIEDWNIGPSGDAGTISSLTLIPTNIILIIMFIINILVIGLYLYLIRKKLLNRTIDIERGK